MMRFTRLLAVALSCTLMMSLPNGAAGRTWYVKADASGDAPTIRAAMDSAQSGDVVLVAAGTYTWTSEAAVSESMIQLKPGVVLQGQAGAVATILDAERRGRVFLGQDLGDQVTVQGLTVQNARGPDGAGMLITGASTPRVVECIFQDNWIDGGVDLLVHGGAVSCSNGVFESCVFTNNHAMSALGARGGAIYSSGEVTIFDCRFEGNQAYAYEWDHAFGGAVMLEGDGSQINESLFVSNSVGAQNGGNAAGGGVYCTGAVTIERSTFVGNSAVRTLPPFPATGGAIAAGIATTIRACTLLQNTASGSEPWEGPPGVSGIHSDGTVEATLIWGSGLACGGDGTWRCCNLFGSLYGNQVCGTDGGGNFSADPLFCSPDPIGTMDCSIHADSPCAPGHHPAGADSCDLIGAGDVSCGPTAVQGSTWSAIKSRYR